jgi:3-isopropylmalate dehydratase small subunit
MNTYNIYNENESSTILFHAIAENENQVIELAEEKSIDLTGLTIELEKSNVKNQMGKSYSASISDAIVH